MIEVEADRHLGPHLLGHLYGAHRHVAEHGRVCILSRALADLDDHRRAALGTGGYDRLKLLEVVEIVGRNRIAAVKLSSSQSLPFAVFHNRRPEQVVVEVL